MRKRRSASIGARCGYVTKITFSFNSCRVAHTSLVTTFTNCNTNNETHQRLQCFCDHLFAHPPHPHFLNDDVIDRVPLRSESASRLSNSNTTKRRARVSRLHWPHAQ